MVQCQGPRVQNNGKSFLVLTYIWQEDVAKNFEVLGAPHNVSPARAIAWLQGVTIYCTIFQLQPTSTSPVFTLQNNFEK